MHPDRYLEFPVNSTISPMRGVFPLIVFLCALSAFAVVAWIVLRERRRYQRELAIRSRLVEQARPVLYAAQCAACGGALSTWDGGLTPLPAGIHVAPAASQRKLVVEYAARRECLGCRLEYVLHLWSDGDNWGFSVPGQTDSTTPPMDHR